MEKLFVLSALEVDESIRNCVAIREAMHLNGKTFVTRTQVKAEGKSVYAKFELDGDIMYYTGSNESQEALVGMYIDVAKHPGLREGEVFYFGNVGDMQLAWFLLDIKTGIAVLMDTNLLGTCPNEKAEEYNIFSEKQLQRIHDVMVYDDISQPITNYTRFLKTMCGGHLTETEQVVCKRPKIEWVDIREEMPPDGMLVKIALSDGIEWVDYVVREEYCTSSRFSCHEFDKWRYLTSNELQSILGILRTHCADEANFLYHGEEVNYDKV